jgi:hypothetical protein
MERSVNGCAGEKEKKRKRKKKRMQKAWSAAQDSYAKEPAWG